MNERTSVLALIVSNESKALRFREVFDDLLETYGDRTDDHQMIIKPFKSVGEFLRAQKETKTFMRRSLRPQFSLIQVM